MSTDSDFADLAASINKHVLGIDKSAERTEAVQVEASKLREAIDQAYQAGSETTGSHEGGLDTEALFWQLMDSLPDHVYFKDARSRFICVNRAQARFLGVVDPNDAIGKSDFDFFEEENARARFEEEQEIMNTGIGWDAHEELDVRSDGDNLCIIASKLPLRDPEGNIVGTFGISRDVTDRYRAEREVERQRNLLDIIIQILPCRLYVRDADDRFLIVNNAYVEAADAKSRDEFIGKRVTDFFSDERSRMLLEEDQRIKRDKIEIRDKIRYDDSSPDEEKWIVFSKVPLIGDDQNVEGIVGMTYDISEQKRAEEESRRLGEELSQKNDQFEAELLVARQLQETLMSMGFDAKRTYAKAGPTWEFEASYFYKPSHHLAGDFFELVPIGKNKLGILLCDVMGHGVKAALVTMLLRGLLLEMKSYLDEPSRVLESLNNSLCSLAEDQDFPRFVTAVYFVVDLSNGKARIANAGHPRPIWRVTDPNGRIHSEPCPSEESGPALGLIEGERFQSKRLNFQGATELLFFTDGIAEQKDAAGREFGIEKLEEILEQIVQTDLQTQLSALKSDLKLVSGAKDFDDDICIVAVKMRPKQG